jgi:hypothetical protein
MRAWQYLLYFVPFLFDHESPSRPCILAGIFFVNCQLSAIMRAAAAGTRLGLVVYMSYHLCIYACNRVYQVEAEKTNKQKKRTKVWFSCQIFWQNATVVFSLLFDN